MIERYTIEDGPSSYTIFDNEKGRPIAYIALRERAKQIVEKLNAKDRENKEANIDKVINDEIENENPC